MTLEEFKKEWKKILIDKDISEAELWRQLGVSQQAGNRKIREGTIKYLEFVNILEKLGYKIKIEKSYR